MEKLINFYNTTLHYLEENYIILVFIAAFVVIGFIVSNFIQRRIRLRLVKKSPNHITANFTSQIIGFVLKSLIIFTALYLLGLGSFVTKLFAGVGLLTLVVGFALKDIGENFLAGIILVFKSPFRLDDLIEVNGIIGYVKNISIRETLIKTPDGKDVFLPNSIIFKNPLYNYTLDGFLRYEFTVGIAYENNPTEAIKLILETVKNVDGVLQDDQNPIITIDELATNTINIKVRFWIDAFKSTTKQSLHYIIRSQVIDAVMKALFAEGFNLPTNIVEIKKYEIHEDSGIHSEQKK